MSSLASLKNIEENCCITLDQHAIISVTGEQRDSYLHGQLTVDINKLADDQARRAAHCDFKGKAWALMTVCRFSDAVLLSIAKDALTSSMAQLQKYGVFSKIEIRDEASHFQQFALQGTQAEAFVIEQFGKLPESPMQSLQSSDGLVIRQDYPQSLYWLILSPAGAEALQTYVRQNQIVNYPSSVYEALAVENGIPDVTNDNINQFVPQMMNLQALNGIDFNKGCYMGQEVVARTRYLGRNKRAAFSFCIPAALAVKPGDILEKQLGDNWRRGGTVIRAATLGAETWIMAVLANDTEMNAVHRLASAPEHSFTPITLPYSVEPNSENLAKQK
ncbi:tRNA-modifying protein YgfZ [Alteromonas pelagimontana]|uniref:tRNA-modifying protein YgfZ n=1 Tax=Alteromonas pelagimontana TaxID=1858656 RepID=A0A6M4MGL3_9ALTE|nr:tRNA-modifying protein YgfZ [Alteromonas pelagimontana]QJR82087.1 tRNA-modifying protein YgfZ [Alteromonas pelagimontana]